MKTSLKQILWCLETNESKQNSKLLFSSVESKKAEVLFNKSSFSGKYIYNNNLERHGIQS
jgi:hypothetical protein